MYRVRDEAIHMRTTEGKTKNQTRMPFLSERCTNNFKDLEVAIEIWSNIKRVTDNPIFNIYFYPVRCHLTWPNLLFTWLYSNLVWKYFQFPKPDVT